MRATSASLLVGVLAFSGASVLLGAQVPRPASATAAADAAEYRQLLDKYCVSCHNQKLKTAGLLLDQADITKIADGAAVWEKVHRKLREGSMPPQGRPRPPQEDIDRFSTWLVSGLDRAAAANPHPGRPSIHRLNQTEYVNVIRDALGLTIDGPSLLPSDDVAYGFDNIADVLTTSPTLMERYLTAAEKISRLATGDPSLPAASTTYSTPLYIRQDDRMSDAMPFGSRGGLAVRHRFVVDGEYLFRVRLQQKYDGSIRGLQESRVIDLFIDGERIQRFTVAAQAGYGGGEFDADAGLQIRVPLKAGERTVAVTFPKKFAYREAMAEPIPNMTAFAYNSVNFEPAVDRLIIDGPFDASGSGKTASRNAIFTCRAASGTASSTCADEILTRLGTRLYRRPIGAKDLQILRRFFEMGQTAGGFEEGVRTSLERMLVDPQFLFRLDRDPANVKPGQAYRLSDLDLASRISFFLWSSSPDQPLLDAAVAGRLHEPAVLEREVHRMLADPRAEALVTNFGGQWLWLRNLSAIQPNPKLFPEWEDTLREGLRRETEMFLDSMIREDHGIPELLTANYTFLNERLAGYYGISNVYGSHFRKVTVADPQRQGLLGQGSILAVTSYDNRTSPVKRGNWLLENIVGAPSPPPPPNVPSLPENDPNKQVLTMRERMAAHRKNPVCASCHTRIDPLGFALEVFDGIGKARTNDGGNLIDTAGELPNGAKFHDVQQLRELLIHPPDRFVETVTAKLLTYAVGRGIEYYDLPAVRQIARDAGPGYRWSSVILGIIKSVPFQMRDAPSTPAPAAVSAGLQSER
jgi:mono/diheme cytochrome c family protein